MRTGIELDRKREDERNRAIVRGLGQVVYEWFPAEDRLEWSGAYERVLRATAGELGARRKDWARRVHPEDLSSALAEIDEGREARRPYAVDYRFRAGDGTYLWLHDQGVILVDDRGAPEHFIGILRDITSTRWAAAAHRDLEQRYRRFIELTSEGIYSFEPQIPISTTLPVGEQIEQLYQGRVVACNDALARMYGYQRADELIGRTLAELHGGTEDPTNRDFLERWIANGYRINASESREQSRTGETVWFSNTAVGIECDGHLASIWGSQTDITARKVAEERLVQSEKHLRLAVEAASLTSFEWDIPRDEVRRVVSPASVSGRGEAPRTFDEVLAEIHPEDRKAFTGGMEAALHDPEGLYRNEYRLMPRDGGVTWLADRGRVERDASGRPQRLIGLSLDMTERVQAQHAIEAERNRAEHYLDIAAVMLLALDPAGRIRLVNPAGYAILGSPGDDLIGRDWFETFIPAHRREAVRGVFAQLLSGELAGVAEAEDAIVDARGEERIIAWRNSVIRDSDGRITGTLSSGEDITERRRAELALREAHQDLERRVQERTAELAQANVRLQELDRLKSMFIASISHELRTPLNSLLGFTGLMRMEPEGLPERHRDYLRRMESAGRHLLDLITDVIDVSKIEAGKIAVEPESVRLPELVDEALRAVEDAARLRGLRLSSTVPDLELEADRQRLFQCLFNLLSNAVKYSEEGEIRVTATEEPHSVTIAVQDEGIGIAPERMHCLFQQFCRIDSPHTRTVPGTGLGLYLTRKIVQEVLGGEVGVESSPGAGSTFWITIPRELPE